MNEQAIRFRFGIFVLASLILLAVLTILFGGFPNYFKHSDSYTIVFSNAAGIAPGTPVRRSGVRIGEVHTVKLDDETGKVNVVINIDDNYSLRKADRPTLVQGLIGGDAAISFLPPDDPKLAAVGRVEPGAVLVGVTPPDAGTLLQQTGDLVKPAQEALAEVRKVFQGIEKLTPVLDETLKEFRDVGKMTNQAGPELKKASEEIGSTARTWNKVGERVEVLLKVNEEKITKSIDRLDDTLRRVNDVFGDENQKYIRETLKNFRDGSQQIDSIAKNTDALIKDSRVAVKQLNDSLKKADGAIDDLQKAIKPLGDRGPTILKNVEESTENLNRSLKDMRDLMRVIAQNDGTIQRLLSDPALYNNLNDSALMVTKILPRLDHVMRDFEIMADKLARHPELIGLPGVIRPSSGLKESPSVIPYRVWPCP